MDGQLLINVLNKIIKDKFDGNVSEYARKAGISIGNLHEYIKGRCMPKKDTIEKLARAAGISETEFYGAPKSAEQRLPAENNHEFVSIPMVSGRIAAGGGLVPDNRIELNIAFRKDWIRRHGNPQKMSLIRVEGDSMEPTLFSGDTVLVNHDCNYISPQGGIYALAIDDMAMIKRVQILVPLQKIRIISDNAKYGALEVDACQVVINGKVIWFGREVER